MPSREMCGASFGEAMDYLTRLEEQTEPISSGFGAAGK
jgi:hypothetical protein